MTKYTPIFKVELVRESSVKYWASTSSPEESYKILRPELENCPQEKLMVMMLNTKNKVTGIIPVVMGSGNVATLNAADVFRPAIAAGNVTSIILGHNHPSGDSTPSPEDVQVTNRLIEAGKLLGIQVLDHIVVGHDCYTSLAMKGLGNFCAQV